MKKNTIKLNESTLKQIIAESIRKVMNEGGISLSDYDNPNVRHNRMDSDAPWEQDDMYIHDAPTNEPYYDADEERWGELVAMKNQGLLSDAELDAIRDKFGY